MTAMGRSTIVVTVPAGCSRGLPAAFATIRDITRYRRFFLTKYAAWALQGARMPQPQTLRARNGGIE